MVEMVNSEPVGFEMVDSDRADLERVEARLVAATVMTGCCGLSMAIALGLVAFGSVVVVAGVAFAAALACAAVVTMWHHGRGPGPASSSHR